MPSRYERAGRLTDTCRFDSCSGYARSASAVFGPSVSLGHHPRWSGVVIGRAAWNMVESRHLRKLLIEFAAQLLDQKSGFTLTC